jgi:hypothetical protein
MATALEQAFAEARKTGKTLSSAQQKKLAGLIGVKGKKDTISLKELQKGQKTYKASGKDFGDYLSAVAGTFGESKLKGGVRKKLTSAGYAPEGGYYTKKAPISEDIISSVQGKGFGDTDIRKYLAQSFSQKELGEGIGKFMGGGDYKLNPDTGKWEAFEPVKPPETTLDDINKTTTKGGGIFEGLNPDAFPGVNPMEMEYAALVDPYKIQAKSSERIAKTGQKTTLQAAKIAQGTSLYNLIPSAF